MSAQIEDSLRFCLAISFKKFDLQFSNLIFKSGVLFVIHYFCH